MKVLVTGGVGFIGSHLVDSLLESQHSVIVLENLTTGRWENISHHEANKNFRMFNIDISEKTSLIKYFNHELIVPVYHNTCELFSSSLFINEIGNYKFHMSVKWKVLTV